MTRTQAFKVRDIAECADVFTRQERVAHPILSREII
jgi:hypothetical protein